MMTNQQAVDTFEAVVTPTAITVCDQQERIAYHKSVGNESILSRYERHKDFFRSLARICRAMTDESIFIRITPDE